jgi:MFS family permease
LALAFITRPLGGLLIGAFADRAGRKPAMLLTIALITVGTIGMALTPRTQASDWRHPSSSLPVGWCRGWPWAARSGHLPRI